MTQPTSLRTGFTYYKILHRIGGAMSTKEEQCASCKGTGCAFPGCDGNCEGKGEPKHATCYSCAGFGTTEAEDTITMTRPKWDALQKHMADLERSAESAREIARVAMSSTGTRAMRVELVARDDGVTIIVCDPAGDEVATAKRMAGFLDKTLWARIGIKFTDDDPVITGSTA